MNPRTEMTRTPSVNHKHRAIVHVLFGVWLSSILTGCAPSICEITVELQVDLSHINEGNGPGDNGEDFREEALTATLAITQSSDAGLVCPYASATTGTLNIEVVRSGAELQIIAAEQTLSFELEGNVPSRLQNMLQDPACENALSNIGGLVDYETQTLRLSYTNTITDRSNCIAFDAP